jgi:hypothetical protein
MRLGVTSTATTLMFHGMFCSCTRHFVLFLVLFVFTTCASVVYQWEAATPSLLHGLRTTLQLLLSNRAAHSYPTVPRCNRLTVTTGTAV